MNAFLDKIATFLFGSPQYALATTFEFDYDFDEGTPDKEKNLMFKKGGSTESVVEKPVYTAPPAAPSPVEAATQEEAITPEEEMSRKKEALKKGAKSLQIPIAGGTGATGQVGTGTGA